MRKVYFLLRGDDTFECWNHKENSIDLTEHDEIFFTLDAAKSHLRTNYSPDEFPIFFALSISIPEKTEIIKKKGVHHLLPDTYSVLYSRELKLFEHPPLPSLMSKPFCNSQAMENNVCELEHFDGLIYIYKGVPHVAIKHTRTCYVNAPWCLVSIGTIPTPKREVIIFNPRSEVLAAMYKRLVDKLPSRGLEAFFVTVRAQLISLFSKSSVEALDKLTASWCGQKVKLKGGKRCPVIPLEYFIRKGIGVCRHIALILAYMYDKASIDGIIPRGNIHVHRDTTKGAGHTWCVFVMDDYVYVIDIIKNINTELSDANIPTLIKHYGRAAVTRMFEYYAPEEEENTHNFSFNV